MLISLATQYIARFLSGQLKKNSMSIGMNARNAGKFCPHSYTAKSKIWQGTCSSTVSENVYFC